MEGKNPNLIYDDNEVSLLLLDRSDGEGGKQTEEGNAFLEREWMKRKSILLILD